MHFCLLYVSKCVPHSYMYAFQKKVAKEVSHIITSDSDKRWTSHLRGCSNVSSEAKSLLYPRIFCNGCAALWYWCSILEKCSFITQFIWSRTAAIERLEHYKVLDNQVVLCNLVTHAAKQAYCDMIGDENFWASVKIVELKWLVFWVKFSKSCRSISVFLCKGYQFVERCG